MILVTGGAGFIGANFVLDWLATCDEPVLNLDKLTYAGNLHNLASLQGDARHVFVQGDIGDRALVDRLLASTSRAPSSTSRPNPRRPLHPRPRRLHPDQRAGHLQAAGGRTALLASAGQLQKEAFRFLHVSTDEVYGTLAATRPAFTEDHTYEPNSPYSASKAASDHLVRAWHHTYGLPVLTTNCSNNYGPYHFPEKLIPLMIVNALAGKPCRCTATACRCATGSTCATTAAPSAACSKRASWAKPTTWAAGTKSPTSTSCTPSALCSTSCAPRRRASYRARSPT
jgi:dTDP-glucose 4,6-dehydratase